jgi:hypothetical protein
MIIPEKGGEAGRLDCGLHGKNPVIERDFIQFEVETREVNQ